MKSNESNILGRQESRSPKTAKIVGLKSCCEIIKAVRLFLEEPYQKQTFLAPLKALQGKQKAVALSSLRVISGVNVKAWF